MLLPRHRDSKSVDEDKRVATRATIGFAQAHEDLGVVGGDHHPSHNLQLIGGEARHGAVHQDIVAQDDKLVAHSGLIGLADCCKGEGARHL